MFIVARSVKSWRLDVMNPDNLNAFEMNEVASSDTCSVAHIRFNKVRWLHLFFWKRTVECLGILNSILTAKETKKTWKKSVKGVVTLLIILNFCQMTAVNPKCTVGVFWRYEKDCNTGRKPNQNFGKKIP